jgi:hypothetical protein
MPRLVHALVFAAMLVPSGWGFAEERANDHEAVAEREREALLGFLAESGVDLRFKATEGNVISHVYSVGPNHDRQYLIGLGFFQDEPGPAEVIRRQPIAIPFVVNRHWVLWQVGGPRGNATGDYLEVWARVRKAFDAYVPHKTSPVGID